MDERVLPVNRFDVFACAVPVLTVLYEKTWAEWHFCLFCGCELFERSFMVFCECVCQQ